MMLYKLLSRIDRKRFLPEVISIGGNIPERTSLVKRYKALNIPVCIYDFSKLHTAPIRLLSLVKHLRRQRPHFVSTWMYHADLIGGLAAFLAGKIPVVWNIRHSNLDKGLNKRTTLLFAGVCARLSRYLPKKIICCAHKAKETHVAIGYAQERMLVIPNGFDLEAFCPDPFGRKSVRRELGLSDNTLVIGMIGRFDTLKGHGVFIQAAKIFVSKSLPVNFVLCGDDVSWKNKGLAELIEQLKLQAYFHLLGRRSDMPKVFSAFDVVTSASFGEGFSNVIGEAMSCAVPCVVTDVGDSALIVGNTGIVISPKSPEQLAEAWHAMATLGAEGRKQLGNLARQRITEVFSLPGIVHRYEELFEDMVNSNNERP